MSQNTMLDMFYKALIMSKISAYAQQVKTHAPRNVGRGKNLAAIIQRHVQYNGVL